ncbi:MAG: DUF4105 domain-containing protein [Bacteroidaceae bacterium]
MMQNRLNSLLIVIFLLILNAPAEANSYIQKDLKTNVIESGTDSASNYRISLLTCSAGEEIYAYFGHTAIRVENFVTKEDFVYNYGQFNMNQTHFIWHFILGQTDYQMGKETFYHFARIYTYINRNVSAQILNLTNSEAETLVENLENNYKPQNRSYRYNYFYDNCSTRPYLIIKKSIEGELLSDGQYQPRSWRDEVNKCTIHASWSNLGMNFLLGAPTDKDMTETQQLFLPSNLERTLQSAKIKDKNGETRSLVLQQCQVIQRDEAMAINEQKISTPFISAIQAAVLFLILTLFITFIDYKRKKRTLWFDVILYTILGILGLVLTFMGLFSSHPCLIPNYELLLFNPLLLICIGSTIRQSRNTGRRYISKCFSVEKSRKRWSVNRIVYLITLCCLLLFIIDCIFQLLLNIVIIQYYPPAFFVLALCLLIRLLYVKK